MIDEFIKRMTENLTGELEEIEKNQEAKGFMDNFDQGRSFEIGVCEGLMARIKKEMQDDGLITN